MSSAIMNITLEAYRMAFTSPTTIKPMWCFEASSAFRFCDRAVGEVV